MAVEKDDLGFISEFSTFRASDYGAQVRHSIPELGVLQ
jgi:hypothetical protein